MDHLQAFLLGLLQGLTEFLPVSSSGHLALGSHFLGIEEENNLLFTIVVHGATVLSTIVVFRKDIWSLIKAIFSFQWNEETQYIAKLIVSMIPIGVAGVLFKDQIEALFDGNIVFVGCMLLLTACLLSFTYFFKRKNDREVGFKDAIIIGIAQAMAVVPGISRSGSTIATGLLLGDKKDSVAKFSFLMVLAPIIGANLLEVVGGDLTSAPSVSVTVLMTGFVTAFLSGLLACKWMINIVKRGKLIYFAIYCAVVGLISIFVG
ncbi:undecaprenyl-diphosphate phosphatase [Halosquirtibacter xylanolyticus]|uniref:undecaprenyl-diphosphate phosphatase n=1 Tax=Halosquirtibacter xylanolyticus TaxID=3374599 RepID=UPI0037484ACF|nr:undecaprenyl-diphosphate phosphatase [Prolixibacteraceae bacterium]